MLYGNCGCFRCFRMGYTITHTHIMFRELVDVNGIRDTEYWKALPIGSM